MTSRPRRALGVSLCAAGLVGFAATYLVLAASRSHDACSAGLEKIGCQWPPLWALFAGVCGTLASFALVVTGLLVLLVSAARAREERTRTYLGSRRALSPSVAREPH